MGVPIFALRWAFLLAPLLLAPLLLRTQSAEAANVRWTMGDSLVTVCPGGDSVLVGRPSILRIAVTYTDSLGIAKVGVPPESVWVTLGPTGTGSILLHDATDAGDGLSWKVFADDATDGAGLARISLFGFSGCGDLYVRVYVHGVSQGTRTARVRSLDADIHDPVDAVVDSVNACDWDYSGSINSSDYALLHTHADHAHRNALHGTLVKRTTACGTCGPEEEGDLGASQVSWSPDGHDVAYTQFTGSSADCIVFTVPSSPTDGNTATQRTFPSTGLHDYDPEWSPLGGEIAFDREDSTLYALSTSTGALRLISHSDDNGDRHRGDVMPAISPDGRWVVYARKKVSTSNPPVGGPFQLWKIPIGGTPSGATATQLTFISSGNDFYPQWAPDGKHVLFERTNPTTGRRTTFIMSADTAGSERALFVPSAVDSGMAVTPAFSRDGAIVLTGAGRGGPSDAVLQVRTMSATLPAQGALVKTVLNYPAFQLTGATDTEEEAFAVMSPRTSPDGTRLAVRASPPETPFQRPQLWATRRNMSLPPNIDALGAAAVVDSAPVVSFQATVGQELDIVVEASDPEDDPLTYKAYFLREDLDMTFSPSTQTFSWVPPQESDLANPYYVRFQVETASGGTDYAIARISVQWPGGGGGCPTLSTYTGRGWRSENTILGRSKDGRNLTDVLKLREKPARVQNHYRLQISEQEQERTTLDQVQLLAVDHDPGLEALASESAMWLGNRKPAHRVRSLSGKDLTPLIGSLGEVMGGSPGEVLLVDMDDPAETGSGSSIKHDDPGIFEEPCCEKERPGASMRPVAQDDASAIDASILNNSGFTIQATDQGGLARVLGDLYPRENGDVALIEGAGSGSVRIAFKGAHHLRFVGKLANATKVAPLELPLVSAKHSERKNVLDAVTSLGKKSVTIDPGQSVDLEFEAPPVAPGLARDLFLVSRGVYTAMVAPTAGNGVLPSRFALAQNQPNPFGKSTLIRFELPTKAKMKLELFDLLGRRVRMLADREFEPGYQSVEWDRTDRSGATLPAGVYLYRMTAPGFRDQKKLTLLAN